MKKTLFAVIALIGALALSSCGRTNPVEQKVSAISFRQGTEMVLATGESERLTVVFEPEGTTSILTWSTSDTLVADVSTNGTVKGIYPGEATITASCENGTVTASIKVTVKDYLETVNFTQFMLVDLDTLGYGGDVYEITASDSTTYRVYKALLTGRLYTEGLYLNESGKLTGSTQGAYIEVTCPCYYASAYLTGKEGGTIFSLGQYAIMERQDTTHHACVPGKIDEEKFINAMDYFVTTWNKGVEAQDRDLRMTAYDALDSADLHMSGATMMELSYHSTEEGYPSDSYYLSRIHTAIVPSGVFSANKKTNVSSYMYGLDYCKLNVRFLDMNWGCNWNQDEETGLVSWADKNVHYKDYTYEYGELPTQDASRVPVHNVHFVKEMPMVEYILEHPATNLVVAQ